MSDKQLLNCQLCGELFIAPDESLPGHCPDCERIFDDIERTFSIQRPTIVLAYVSRMKHIREGKRWQEAYNALQSKSSR